MCKQDIETDFSFCSGFVKSSPVRPGTLRVPCNGAEPVHPVITDKRTRDLKLSRAFCLSLLFSEKPQSKKKKKKHEEVLTPSSRLRRWIWTTEMKSDKRRWDIFFSRSSLQVNAGPGRGRGITCLAFHFISPLICEGRWNYSISHTLHELIASLS